MARIINITNRLPLTIGEEIVESSGGLVSALEGVRHDYDMIWVGWPGKVTAGKKDRLDIEKLLARKYNCLPVFLDKDEITGYYHGFSNSTLWPLLHYRSHYIRYRQDWWRQYKKVNRKFTDVILKIAKEDDIIWVHDYQLMLVPQMLKQSGKNLKVGFFLHTPFPSYEVFRCHPQRKELLAGMLGADLIGFQTFGYMRHFRSSAMRLLGADCDSMVIRCGDRKCYMGVFPIGANVQSFQAESKKARFRKKLADFKRIYRHKKVILSVERLDYSKGIIRRLEAIDRFLGKWQDKNNIVFIFISVPSRDEVPEYAQLKANVESMVGRLNGKHATVENIPIHFIYKSVDFTELCALYRLADVAMVTPLMDGMNLVAKEFVACRPDFTGALILSEFTGAANELFQAFIANPYDIDAVADSLELAINAQQDDIKRRMRGMYERVTQFDAKYWARKFINEFGKLEIEDITAQKEIDVRNELVKRIKKSKKMVFFLDYDSTLCDLQNDPDKAGPDEQVKQLLETLSCKKNIDTFLISGRKGCELEKWFGKYNITLIAEHGFSYHSPQNDRWLKSIRNVDLSWKKSVREIFEQYVGITQGSFIEEKKSSIVWHYRMADPEFGLFNAQQLMAMLQDMLSNVPVEVRHGKKIIEVSLMQANKGLALMRFAGGKSKYDFVLCAGDDQTDESMFKLADKRLFKVKVGQGQSSAEFRLDSPKEFINILLGAIRNVR
ncbi:MAG: bifunctional alpha,alpha-trehalose-phosphate synthase (UDP-forming)/trehalose-phosphatase [Planctomycetes bacterium HGW-Planctomycetes-1]|nr:MAG: bifunctional alpha,alpha-trehalose-phosphate synthase (UDP-forming)/trehalose-phosphatase [Planctomycetes bacterium HGW-Planctomycetes-1]